jgi:REP element-mobilizing transposase RayT
VNVLREVVEEFDIECWNYCVMPNHYHATLRPTLPNLSEALQRLNSDYAKWWNVRHQRVGHVFQGRFKDQIVQCDRYLLALCRYVALNPVRAGLAQRPEEWPWSSYAATVGLTSQPTFVLIGETLRQFGDGDLDALQARFAEFVEGSDGLAVDTRIRSSVRILGDKEFRTSVGALDTDGLTRLVGSSPDDRV